MPFKKGDKRPDNAGRKPGSVNKVTKTVRERFLEVFNKLQENEDSEANLLNWAENNPDEFYPLAAKLIPTELNGTLGTVAYLHLSEDQVKQIREKKNGLDSEY